MAGLSGALTEFHTQKVLLVVDINAAFLQAPRIADQISSATDSFLRFFADVSRKVWWGFKCIDSSVSPVCYERKLRQGNSELKRVALEKPTFRPIIPEAKAELKDETGTVSVESLQVKEDTLGPYESFHQALRALTPPIQAVSESDSCPSRWKHINAPVREALSVFPWDMDEFPESPPQKRDGESFVTSSVEEQATLKGDFIVIFTELPATAVALQSFLEGSPVDRGEESMLGEYRKTLGALKEAGKQRSIQLIFVNTAVAHGEGHGKTPGDASRDSFELAVRDAGIWTIPLQALAFGGDVVPASAALPALFGLRAKPVVESPVCAGFFGEIPVQLFQQGPSGPPKKRPALAVFGPSATVALLRASASCQEKWYDALGEDLNREERYVLRCAGGSEAAADFADILCQLNDQHSVLHLTLQDGPFSFKAILEPCSPSCATLTLCQDVLLDCMQKQLGLLSESAWKPESCQLVDTVAADIKQMYVDLKAHIAKEQKPAATSGKDRSGALENGSQQPVVESREELPQAQKLLLAGRSRGEGEADYRQDGGGRKRPNRKRSKEGGEGLKGSHRKRAREGLEASAKPQRKKKRRRRDLVAGAERGEEAQRPKKEEADSRRRRGPHRSENKGASAGQTASVPVPRNFTSRVGGRHVKAILSQKAARETAPPSHVPNALPTKPPRLPPQTRQPGLGTRPPADVSENVRMSHGHLSPAQDDPEAVLTALKEQARRFAKGKTGGSAADFAGQVVRQAERALLSRGVEGAAGRPPQKEGSSEGGSGSHGYGPQALVPCDPLANGGVVKDRSEGGSGIESVGKELKRLFLLPPKKLVKKYIGCLNPKEGSDGKNAEGYSVDDKIREHTLQIFLRFEILGVDPPSRRALADTDLDTERAKVQRSMVQDITEVLKNVSTNLRGEGLAGSVEQFLDCEVKPRYGSKLSDVLNHVYLDNQLSAPFPEPLDPPAAREREEGVKRPRKRKHKRAALVPLQDDMNALLLREQEVRTARTNGESQFGPINPKLVVTQQLTRPKPLRGKDKLKESSRALQSSLFGSELGGLRSAHSGFRSEPSGSPSEASSDQLTGYIRGRKNQAGARLLGRPAGGVQTGRPAAPPTGAPANGAVLALLGPPEPATADVSNGLRRAFADVGDDADRAPAAALRGSRALPGGTGSMKASQIGGVAVRAGAQTAGEPKSQSLRSELKSSRPVDLGDAPDLEMTSHPPLPMTSLAPGALFGSGGVGRMSLGGEEEESEYEVEATPWKVDDVVDESDSGWGNQESPGEITGLDLESALDGAVEGESPVETTGYEKESGDGVLRRGDGAEDSGAQAQGEEEPLAEATGLVSLAGDIPRGPEREAAPEAVAHVGDEYMGLSAPPEAAEEKTSPPEREAAGDPPTPEATPEATPEKRSPSPGDLTQDPVNTPGETPLRPQEPFLEETTPPSKSRPAQGSLRKRKRGKGSAVGIRTRGSTPRGGGLRSGRKLRPPDPTWWKARKTPLEGARPPDSDENGASDRKRRRTSGTEKPDGTEMPDRGASEEVEAGSGLGNGGVRSVSKERAAGEGTPGGAGARFAPGGKASEKELPVVGASGKQPLGKEGSGSKLARRLDRGKEFLNGAEGSSSESHTNHHSAPAAASPASIQGGSTVPPLDGSLPPGSKAALAQTNPPDENPLRRHRNRPLGKTTRAGVKAEGGGAAEETRGGTAENEGDASKPGELGIPPRRGTRQSSLTSACVPDSVEKRAGGQKRKRTSENGTPDGAASEKVEGASVERGAVATPVTSASVSDRSGSARKRKRTSENGTTPGTVERAPVGEGAGAEPVSEKVGSRKDTPGPRKVALGTKASGEQRPIKGKGKERSKKRVPGSEPRGAGKLFSVKGEGCSEPKAGHVSTASPGLTSSDRSPGSLDTLLKRGSKSPPGQTDNSLKRATLPSASPSPGAPVSRETRPGGEAKKAATIPAGKETRAGGNAKKAATTPAGKEARAGREAEEAAGRGTRAGGEVRETAATLVGKETRSRGKAEGAATTPGWRETRAAGKLEGPAATLVGRETRAGRKAEEAPTGKATGARGKAQESAATQVEKRRRAGGKAEAAPTGTETRAGRKAEEVIATPIGEELKAAGKVQEATAGRETRAGGKSKKAGASSGLVTPGKSPGLRSGTKARELSGSSLRSGKKLPLTPASVPDSEERISSGRKRKRTSGDGTPASERLEGGSAARAAVSGSTRRKSSGEGALESKYLGTREAKAESPAAGAAPGKETPVTKASGKASPADRAPKTVSRGLKKQSPATNGPSGKFSPGSRGKRRESAIRGTPGTRASQRGKSGKRRSERMSLTGEEGETIERAKRLKEAAFEAWE